MKQNAHGILISIIITLSVLTVATFSVNAVFSLRTLSPAIQVSVAATTAEEDDGDEPTTTADQSATVESDTTVAATTKPHVSGPRNIYLTIDDGPSKNTPGILAILKQYHVKATFFVVNFNHGKYVDFLKNIADDGHAIGLHSASHDYKKIYSSEKAFWADIQKISDVVKDKTGIESKIVRFPGGGSNTISRQYSKGIMTRLAQEVEEKSYAYFDWNCETGDASGPKMSSKDLVNNTKYIAVKVGGDITLLMHDRDDLPNAVKALPEIIEYFQNRGFAFKIITQKTPAVHHRINN
ncbi:MAG: polysaccharide deacetylase [Oscillospiraceae bacterium]|nr:polysaccharide deacetylase [Oscillospiraceae bacterium]